MLETIKQTLPWGKEQVTVQIPAAWHVAGVLEPSSLPAVDDPILECRRSLQNPVGLSRLSKMAKPGMRIALVVDDGSRPTPVNKLIPEVLAELDRAGVDRSQIVVVPGLGIHRPMNAEELAERIGADVLAGLRWENPDCDDPQKLTDLGVTSRGTPVLINRTVCEADLIISIGCIEPHIIASFGGGYKNLVPGVAGRATIAHNHTLNCTPDTFNMVGQPIEHNPMRLDLEEAASMVKKPVFIINAVLNNDIQVVRVVCGDPIDAHREGVRTSAQLYGVLLDHPVDVIITDSNPMDQDLRQGVKALANTIRAVRRGGVMITLVRAEEGTGVFGLANRKLPVGRRMLRILAPILLPLVPKLSLNGMGEEDRFFLYFALQAMCHAKLVMVAPTIPAEIQDRLPFITFAPDVPAAMELARQRFPNSAEVIIFPHGGITFPVIKG